MEHHHAGSFDFFLHEKQVQTGVIFHFNMLRYLFSTTGMVRVKVRFGLVEPADGGALRFHLILFGVDGKDTTITPYYTSAAFTHHHHYPKHIEGEGNLPLELMRLWRRSWHKNVNKGKVGPHMFYLNRAHGGFLQGYSYELKEIMAAVGAFTGTSDIHIKFGLHKYYATESEHVTEPTFVRTFGLMFFASTKVIQEVALDKRSDAADTTDEVIDESGYYDFSAPCPYTC